AGALPSAESPRPVGAAAPDPGYVGHMVEHWPAGGSRQELAACEGCLHVGAPAALELVADLGGQGVESPVGESAYAGEGRAQGVGSVGGHAGRAALRARARSSCARTRLLNESTCHVASSLFHEADMWVAAWRARSRSRERSMGSIMTGPRSA